MTTRWSEEFDGPAGSAVDPSTWRSETGAGGWGNDELQTYTEGTANAALDGAGHLAVTARRTGDGGWTSARLVTKDRTAFRYGVVTVRAQLPGGRGVWPAFWMLGQDLDEVAWPGCGEIDLLECFGTDDVSSTVHGTVHGPGYSGTDGVTGACSPGVDLADDFHDYAVRWEPARVGWLLDGEEYHAVTPEALPGPWRFDHPFFLLVNVAVGGTMSARPDDDLVPRPLLVDHVRVEPL